MYGFWWITIIFGVIALLGIIFMVIKHIRDWDCVDSPLPFFTTFLGGGLFLIFLIISICSPISANVEYETFLQQKEYVQEAYENGTDLDNISITQTVIDLNTWLAEAKASQKVWGIWSDYYYLDLSDVEPISIEN